MTVVRIVADDLTGALDTAGPFVALAGPLPVLWQRRQIAGRRGSFALDTETRDRPGAAADWLDAFSGADLAYKKIDSLLRGATAAEVAACLASGRFRSAVIAPAFPAQQRITRAGRQYWRAQAGDPWQPVPCDLLAELRVRGLTVHHASVVGDLVDDGYVVCDSETEADLAAIVTAGQALARPILWCGTAGLARALAGPPDDTLAPKPRRPLLILVGTRHPVSQAQLEALVAWRPEVVARLQAGDEATIQAALASVGALLARQGIAALALALPETTPEAAGAVMSRVSAVLRGALPAPATLVVTGGDTLHRLVRALGAAALLVGGEWSPGVPWSRIEGRTWAGTEVISKSGAFGAPELLIRLAESAMP